MHSWCFFIFTGIFEAEEVFKVLLKIPAKPNRYCASWGSYVTLCVQSTSRSFQRKPFIFDNIVYRLIIPDTVFSFVQSTLNFTT